MTMEERSSSLAAGPEVASLNLAPDMSKFKLKERLAPLPYPRPALEIDECIPIYLWSDPPICSGNEETRNQT